MKISYIENHWSVPIAGPYRIIQLLPTNCLYPPQDNHISYLTKHLCSNKLLWWVENHDRQQMLRKSGHRLTDKGKTVHPSSLARRYNNMFLICEMGLYQKCVLEGEWWFKKSKRSSKLYILNYQTNMSTTPRGGNSNSPKWIVHNVV